MIRRALPLLPALLLLAPGAALAHPGHGEAVGFAQGFAHPLGGLDHVLAMVAVGLLAGIRGGAARFVLPAAFLAMMAAGAGLGVAGIGLPFAETGIALSIVAFGLAILFGLRLPLPGLVALVGAFAVFHGYAHGTEMPETASGLAYGLGFLGGTALLHAVGLGLGLLVARERRAAPAMGAAVALSGLTLLVGAF
ncbi:HupE/UreJ family protein [Methylobacterium dankookense]|uniref:HupE / UreJ protein n=1 Tax=Methylobacterium dankookense TaxID=560405 RepID=A0A564G1U8_9HYPH|nr:HupE/UreJ family protein [Methylobacterium dankookense]GJD56151.1 hypothetical protein IFDJLNFL_2046 [Methylobacterium dankookense]VUF13940.1 hypothetical protein MTDSW087_03650 [Methylobacterium dankookense]